MPNTNPTFEEVDKHIQSADLKAFEVGGKHHLTAAPPGIAIPVQVCAAYKIIKPILQLLLNVPFIPQTWKNAIRTFMQVLNVFCP